MDIYGKLNKKYVYEEYMYVIDVYRNQKPRKTMCIKQKIQCEISLMNLHFASTHILISYV